MSQNGTGTQPQRTTLLTRATCPRRRNLRQRPACWRHFPAVQQALPAAHLPAPAARRRHPRPTRTGGRSWCPPSGRTRPRRRTCRAWWAAACCWSGCCPGRRWRSPSGCAPAAAPLPSAPRPPPPSGRPPPACPPSPARQGVGRGRDGVGWGRGGRCR